MGKGWNMNIKKLKEKIGKLIMGQEAVKMRRMQEMAKKILMMKIMTKKKKINNKMTYKYGGWRANHGYIIKGVV